LRPHRREDFITKLVHHDFDRGADCPRWLDFLDQVMGGEPGAQRMVSYLQRAIGYSLTGRTSEKAVFVPFGGGDNGKSTMLTTIRQLVEEYAVILQVDTLMVRQESNNTQADLADLRGARFAQTSETEEGQRLAQGKLKRITQGMGTIKAVRKYENPIEFQETHKLWIDTNRKPDIRDADDAATFNRLHPIPFTVRIPKDRIDRSLPERLLAEGEGILAWAVAGAKLWYESGLNQPPEVKAANDEWRSEMDRLTQFLDDCCVIGDGFTVQASVLFAAYRRWSEQNEEKTLSRNEFARKLGDKGFTKQHKQNGTLYSAICLRPTDG
jgi:putative DNA primase/helicase